MIERRRHPRTTAAEPARIVFDYRSVHACTIRDVSPDGACLRLDPGIAIVDTFDLISDGGNDAHICRLIWRSKDRIGVAFRP